MSKKTGHDSSLFLSAFVSVRQHEEYANRWICDAQWHQILSKKYNDLPTIGLTQIRLTRLLNKTYEASFHNFGEYSEVYHVNFRMICPVTSKRRRVHFYYFNTTKTALPLPLEVKGEEFLRNNPLVLFRAKRKLISDPVESDIRSKILRVAAVASADVPTPDVPTPDVAAVASADVQPSVEAIDEDSSSSLIDSSSSLIDSIYYWRSSNARNLFAPTLRSEEDVEEALLQRITLLRNVAVRKE